MKVLFSLRFGVSDILVGKLEGKNHSEKLVVNGKIILEWILGDVGRCGLDSSGSG
jgi:hypothetical protein